MELEKRMDALTAHYWRFRFMHGHLFLTSFVLLKKKSLKHRKFHPVEIYDRIDKRNSTIQESEVPISKEIRDEALQAFFKTISCKLWSEK